MRASGNSLTTIASKRALNHDLIERPAEHSGESVAIECSSVSSHGIIGADRGVTSGEAVLELSSADHASDPRRV
jgi:hypothetical protein